MMSVLPQLPQLPSGVYVAVVACVLGLLLIMLMLAALDASQATINRLKAQNAALRELVRSHRAPRSAAGSGGRQESGQC